MRTNNIIQTETFQEGIEKNLSKDKLSSHPAFNARRDIHDRYSYVYMIL